MDYSKWLQLRTSGSKGNEKNNESKKIVDLDLKLGLPSLLLSNQDDANSSNNQAPPPFMGPFPMSNSPNVTFNFGPFPQAGGISGGPSANVVGKLLIWSPEMAALPSFVSTIGDTVGTSYNMNTLDSFINYPATNTIINPMVNHSPRMAVVVGNVQGGGLGPVKRIPRPRESMNRPIIIKDPLEMIKRCSNPNCNATETPMWRRGPLGPKTLCNACGIKYAKEIGRKTNRQGKNNNENPNA